ncbi:hypothetical protein BD779DRAFT_1643263, partial [Infundibulicybe gibba]
MAALKTGSFQVNGTTHDLAHCVTDSARRTRYYSPDSLLSSWSSPSSNHHNTTTNISILEISTLEGAHYLSSSSPGIKIGVLNFASATKPGGGFLTGAQAQEESLARSSTLYPALTSASAQPFYALHTRNARDGYYSHAMLYSPGVALFRADDGAWTAPLQVDVLTSPAVNAGAVRKSLMGRLAKSESEARIRRVMRERMARLLYLFEKEGVQGVVLGSFGTGVFRNEVRVVAELWAELFEGRFKASFESVVFAVLGRQTYTEFEDVF